MPGLGGLSDPAGMLDVVELTDRERAVLNLEARPWRRTGAKDQAIRDTFDLSSVRYHQLLLALLHRPEAWEYAPAGLARLQRRLEQARRGRAA